MIWPRKLLLAMALLLAVSASALQQDDPRFRIRTRVDLVVVPVTVKDAEGKLVLDIKLAEFRVFEDGVEQEISLFSVDPFPISAVVLLDNGLQLKVAEQVERGAGAIAGGFSESDEVAIYLFDEFSWPVVEFTSSNDLIYDKLKRIQLAARFPGQGSAPMTTGPRINAAPVEPSAPAKAQRARHETKNIDDAILAAAQLLRSRARDRRKIIFLVSDGANSRNNVTNFDDTLKLLLSADISVYAIGVGDAALSRTGNVLARYARATGGDVFYAATRTELESLYARVTEQARNQYTLAYLPHNTDPSREYHSVEVRVRRPHLTLLERDGYYLPEQSRRALPSHPERSRRATP
jgi:VWFA-related protein